MDNIERIMAQMPRVTFNQTLRQRERSGHVQSKEVAAVEAQCRLLAEQGYRKAPELNEADLPINPWWKGRGSNFWSVQAYAQGQQDMLLAGWRKVPSVGGIIV